MGDPSNITLEGLAQAYQQLQAQFTEAQQHISGLQKELNGTRDALQNAQLRFQVQDAVQAPTTTGPKPKKPNAYKGKGSINSWIAHMTNYLGPTPDPNALAVAISYLEGPAHE